MKKTKKEKKRLVLITFCIIGLLITLVSSVFKDWQEILDNNSQIKALTDEYNTLLSEEEKLKSDVTKLQDSEYVARYAKEKFMYSEDGDIIIRMY
ncbi:MAG: septum formation initiator family protein [Bacilli bacterium]